VDGQRLVSAQPKALNSLLAVNFAGSLGYQLPVMVAAAVCFFATMMIWFPFVDAYRTLCTAPSPDIQAVFKDIPNLNLTE
jgi:hypothetical protein